MTVAFAVAPPGCGKRRFDTWKDAEGAARSARRSGRVRTAAPYHCTICDGFHFGGRETRRRKG